MPTTKLSYIKSTTTIPASDDDTAGTSATATAHCETGQSVTGGGVEVESDSEQIVNDSHPLGTNAWTGLANNIGSDPRKMTVFAICASAGDAAP